MAKRDKRKMESNMINMRNGARLRVMDADALRGSSMNIAEINRALYGSYDPDTEMLKGVSKELWEAAIPRFDSRRSKSVGIPMIFGTGGSDNFKNEVMGSWINEPMPPTIGMVEQMNESIRVGNYIPPQEMLRRMSMRDNVVPNDYFGPRYQPITPDEAYEKMIDTVKIPIDRFGKKEDL